MSPRFVNGGIFPYTVDGSNEANLSKRKYAQDTTDPGFTTYAPTRCF